MNDDARRLFGRVAVCANCVALTAALRRATQSAATDERYAMSDSATRATATMIDVRTLGELRDAVARLIEAHGEALPVHSYNDGMGCPEVTLHVTDHHKVGLIVEVM